MEIHVEWISCQLFDDFSWSVRLRMVYDKKTPLCAGPVCSVDIYILNHFSLITQIFIHHYEPSLQLHSFCLIQRLSTIIVTAQLDVAWYSSRHGFMSKKLAHIRWFQITTKVPVHLCYFHESMGVSLTLSLQWHMHVSMLQPLQRHLLGLSINGIRLKLTPSNMQFIPETTPFLVDNCEFNSCNVSTCLALLPFRTSSTKQLLLNQELQEFLFAYKARPGSTQSNKT